MTATAEISIVICTYNRADMLADTLRSWQAVDKAGVQAEMLVIDNASTDHTRQVVQGLADADSFPIRYVHEPTQGLSVARNTGIAQAQAGIIAFVDDDIFFDPQWLQHLIRAFRDQPGIACVGGRTLPVFEAQRPDWLGDQMAKYYGSTASGEIDREFVFPEHPFGVNMAFRRAVFEQVGTFRTDLGRIKTSLLSNEEKELFHRIHHAGLEVWYAAQATLQHRIPAERIEQRWLLQRAYWQGISNVVFDRHVGQGSRIKFLRTMASSSVRLARGSASLFKARWLSGCETGTLFSAQLKHHHLLGTIRQCVVEICKPATRR